MALGLLDIKRRIRSVKNTQKITKAVGLVAVSKFGKIKPAVYKVSSYFDKYKSVIEKIIENVNINESSFSKLNDTDLDLYIIITSDSGLCGNYNIGIINTALEHMYGKKVVLITVGEKGRNYFKRRGYETLAEFVEIGAFPVVEEAGSIMKEAVEYYKQGKVRNVYIAYTRFHSPLKQEPLVMRVLPADKMKEEGHMDLKMEEDSDKVSEHVSPNDLYLFEPSPKELFEFIFPKYLNSLMYYALLNSISCEYASRINSMEAATKSASDILDRLQNIYNKARQSSITQEITEIVSGAEALKS